MAAEDAYSLLLLNCCAQCFSQIGSVTIHGLSLNNSELYLNGYYKIDNVTLDTFSITNGGIGGWGGSDGLLAKLSGTDGSPQWLVSLAGNVGFDEEIYHVTFTPSALIVTGTVKANGQLSNVSVPGPRLYSLFSALALASDTVALSRAME